MALVIKEQSKAPTFLSTALTNAHSVYGVAKHLWGHRNELISVGSKIYSYLVPGSSNSSASSRPSSGRGRMRVNQSNPSSSGFAFNNSPSAINTTLRNTTFWHEQSLPRHIEFGDCVRITGRQVLADAVTTGSDAQLFSGGSATGINTCLLSPDVLGSRLALIARTYDKYAFRYVKIYYFPRVATTQAGGYALAYIQDGSISTYATLDYNTIQQVNPVVVSAFRDTSYLEFVYEGNSVWYCEDESNAGTAEKRQTRQGFISGFPDASSIGAVTMGHFVIEYVCDLFQPICDLGFSVSLYSKEEKELVQKCLAIHRSKHPPPYKMGFDEYVKCLEGKETTRPK